MIRSLAFVALIAASAAPVSAQTAGQPAPIAGQTRSLTPTTTPAAAATLPNSFDGPAATAAVAAPLPPPVVAPTQEEVTQADMAEGALRAVIGDLAQGRIDDALFTPELANRLRPQLTTLRPVVQGFGEIGQIEPQGVSNGATQFLVTFENAVTQWVVGLSDEGRVSALLFRPAPPESSEPEPATETAPAAPPATAAQPD